MKRKRLFKIESNETLKTKKVYWTIYERKHLYGELYAPRYWAGLSPNYDSKEEAEKALNELKREKK